MNLKAHLPIIALCGLAFLVSFAAGLWWEISQQEERQELAPSAKNLKPAIAKPRTDKEKSDLENQTDTEQEKTDGDDKDKPEEPDTAEKNAQDGQTTATSESAPGKPPTPNPSKDMPPTGGAKKIRPQ